MMDFKNLKKEDLKLIVADIDNTLVNYDRWLTDRTREVIRRLKDHGVEFALASGRPLDELESMVERWECEQDLFMFWIGMNGGELYDLHTGKSEEYFKIAPEHLKEALELMEPFDINPCVYLNGNVLCKKVDWMVEKSIQRTKKKAIAYKDYSEMYQQANAKIMFRVPEGKMDEVEAFAKAHPSKYWNVFRTGNFNLEFSEPHINKAYPIEKICERYGYTLDQVVAFGDNSNDDPMLEKAGWGVCLENGNPLTKAISNDVTELDNEHDGLADYIEKNILERFGW